MNHDHSATPAPRQGPQLVEITRTDLKHRVSGLRGLKHAGAKALLERVLKFEEIPFDEHGRVAHELDEHFPNGDVASLVELAYGSFRPLDAATERNVREKLANAIEICRLRRMRVAMTAPDWHRSLRKSPQGGYQASHGNAVVALLYHEAWINCLAFDEFGQRIVFVDEPPFEVGCEPTRDRPYELTDVDYSRAMTWFERASDLNLVLSEDTIRRAVREVAIENKYNVVTAYLEGLKWDRAKRIDDWLIRYCGAEDTPINRVFGRKWLISAIARAFEPGCQVDTCLVLKGDEGLKKTSLFRIIGYADRGWFDTLSAGADFGDKRTLQKLAGRWIFEMPELEALRRNSLEAVKSFITEVSDRYVPMYGRGLVTQPRRFVLGGSTNEAEPLHGANGHRRFWCVDAGAIKAAELQADRDQIWAEALHEYRATAGQDHRWWLAPEETVLARGTQEDNRVKDPWEELLAGKLGDFDTVTLSDLLPKLGLSTACVKLADGQRVARCLRALGWQKKREQKGADRKVRWERGPNAEPRPVVAAQPRTSFRETN